MCLCHLRNIGGCRCSRGTHRNKHILSGRRPGLRLGYRSVGVSNATLADDISLSGIESVFPRPGKLTIDAYLSARVKVVRIHSTWPPHQYASSIFRIVTKTIRHTCCRRPAARVRAGAAGVVLVCQAVVPVALDEAFGPGSQGERTIQHDKCEAP